MSSAAVRYGIALGCFALGLVLGVVLDQLVRMDAQSQSAAPAGTTAMNPGPHGASGAPSSRSLEDAAQVLALRLSISGGADADWELLEKAYQALGRPKDAELARLHEVQTGRGIEDAVAASSGLLAFQKPDVTSSQRAVAPPDAQAVFARAEDHRRKREFAASCSEYEKVAASGAMTADAWADYADALGSRDGTLGPAAKAIDQSLKLDPRHAKALWLKASLEREQKNYAASLVTWKQLLALLPPDSPDSSVVKANVAEMVDLIETNGKKTAKGRGG